MLNHFLKYYTQWVNHYSDPMGRTLKVGFCVVFGNGFDAILGHLSDQNK